VGEPPAQVESEMIPALRAMNLELKDGKQFMADWAYVAQNSTITLGDLGYYTTRYGMSLTEIGIKNDKWNTLLVAMNKAGIQGRPMLMELNQAFKVYTDSVDDATKAQEKLDALHKDSVTTTKDYIRAMQRAGGDVVKMKELTRDYREEQAKQKEKETELINQKTAAEKVTAEWKAHPEEALVGALSERDKRITLEKYKAIDEERIKSAPELYGKYAAVGATPIGGEIAAKKGKDVAMDIGKKVTPEEAATAIVAGESLGVLRDIFALVTLIEGAVVLGKVGAGTAATAAGTEAAAGAEAGTFVSGAGALSVIPPLAALVATIIGTTIVGSAYTESVRKEQQSQEAKWLAKHPGMTGTEYGIAMKTEAISRGQEYIEYTPEEEKRLAQLNIHIENVHLSKDYPVEKFVADMGKEIERQRKQGGYHG
jgi:predicted lactoylglutathione lyase